MPILTQPFAEVLDRILSHYQLDRPMPRIIVDHPIQNVGGDLLRARAEQIARAVVSLLDG